LWWIAVPVLYRIGCYVPIPLVNVEGVHALFNSIEAEGRIEIGYLLPLPLRPLSILAVGFEPYAYASLGVQAVVLLRRFLAPTAETKHWWLRVTGGLGLVIGAIQAKRVIARFEEDAVLPDGTGLFVGPDWLFGLTTFLTLTAATAICVWGSDFVTRKGVANGMVLLAVAAALLDLSVGRFELRVLVMLTAALIAAPGYRRAVLASRSLPQRSVG
jgi:preprotein translocase subunit SecY